MEVVVLWTSMMTSLANVFDFIYVPSIPLISFLSRRNDSVWKFAILLCKWFVFSSACFWPSSNNLCRSVELTSPKNPHHNINAQCECKILSELLKLLLGYMLLLSVIASITHMLDSRSTILTIDKSPMKTIWLISKPKFTVTHTLHLQSFH